MVEHGLHNGCSSMTAVSSHILATGVGLMADGSWWWLTVCQKHKKRKEDIQRESESKITKIRCLMLYV